MKIRLLKRGEIKLGAALAGQNYSQKFADLAARELKEMFLKGPIKPRYFVVEFNKQIVGVGGLIQSWMDYNIFHISWVNIAPTHQGKGFGTKLIDRIMREIKKQKDAEYVLITTRVPKYYRKHWGFISLGSIGTNQEKLMLLKLNKK